MPSTAHWRTCGSNHDQPDDQLLWILHAQADVPGVNYSDDFEVPVFRLTASPLSVTMSMAAFSSDAQGAAAAPAFAYDASDVPAPTNPKVVVSAGINGGTEFYFPIFRNPGRVLVLFVFTAVWTAILYLITHSHAPWFFAVVFGFFELLLIYGLLKSALGSCRIEVDNGKIAYRRGLLGMGATHEVPFSDITQILTVTSAQQKGSPASYSLFLYTKNGDKLTIADAIDSRQEARWVTAQLEKFAGLKLDTHVAVHAGFGPSGPPPQRGEASSASPAAFRRNRPVASAVNLALFLAWISFIGFIGYRFFSYVHAQPKHVAIVSFAASGAASSTAIGRSELASCPFALMTML